MKEMVSEINAVKIPCEIRNLKTTASFVEWSTRKLIKELEGYAEGDMQIKHSHIASIIERIPEKPEKIEQFNQKTGCNVDPEGNSLEFPLPVLVQSGKKFNLNKINMESDSSQLQPMGDAIYMNVCGKYLDMHVMASRVLIINPSDEVKEAYGVAFEAQQHLISLMKPGVEVGSLYTQTQQFI
mmetsp:Transcript_1813/g.2416  ORF Transcript_1813/g.2416 Transcript_1813/m.2416 type:complete len:183 (-) Transcript_1813:2052-2600(-)